MTLMTVCVLGKLTYTVNIHLQLYNYMHAAALDVGHNFFPRVILPFADDRPWP